MAIAGYNYYPGQSYSVPSRAYASTSSGRTQSQNVQQSSGSSFGGSASQSSSFIPDYSQTPILENIAQYAESLAPQVYQWGMDQYAQRQGDINELMRDAKMWASPQRLAVDVGAAQAGVQQAGEQARQNAIQDLQSYGIDPSSGRYAALDRASRVQTAAAAAGAGNQQRMADEQTGLAMRNQAIAAGEQNFGLGTAAAGLANQYLSTAMRLPYSPLGTASQSASQSGSQQQSSGSGSSTGVNTSTQPYTGMLGGGGGGGTRGGGGGSQGGGEGGGGMSGYDPYANVAGANPQWPAAPDATTGGSAGYPASDQGGSFQDPMSFDPNAGVGFDPYSADWNTGGSADGGSAFAEGGAIDDNDGDEPTSGGFVSEDMSPSNGDQTDDVHAKVNVGEFVIPRDVAAWKGQEFFQKLIAQSRKARTTAPARPTFNLGGAI